MKHLLKDTKSLLGQMPHGELMREADALSAELEGAVDKIYTFLRRLDQIQREERRAQGRQPSFIRRVANAVRVQHEDALASSNEPSNLILNFECLRAGDVAGQFLGITRINGVPYHIEAIEVVTDATGQRAAHPESQDLYMDFAFRDFAVETLKHNGREYIVIIHPFVQAPEGDACV